MKRVNESVDGGKENLGLKKVKYFNGIDEGLVVLGRDEAEEERALVGNGAVDPAQVDNNGDRFGNIVPYNLGDQSFDGLQGSNMWDFDINFDTIFGYGEEQTGPFDLNFPVYKAQDGGMEQGCLGYSQGPMINQNKAEIIDIASDDSEDEVEIIGYTNGYNANDKQIESGMPYDRMENLSLGLGLVRMDNAIGDEVEIIGYKNSYNANDKQIEAGMPYDRMENLSLGLGHVRMDNAIGESSLMADVERRYTMEEKGKASVIEDSLIDSWLSLKANSPIDLELTDSGESSESNEPTEDLEIRRWQPVVPVVRPEFAERALQQPEQALRNRERLTREAWRGTALRFARVNLSDRDNGNQSSSQKQQPPTSTPLEQLGSSPGPFSDALKMIRERTSKRAAEQLIEWRPSAENQDRSITAAFVPSLLDLSLKALAESAEGIVSLKHVPDNLRGRLTSMLCDIRKMNAHIMNLLVEGCPTEIRIKNCSWLTEEQFQQAFTNFQTKDLKVLQLDLCGQCMLDIAFRDILDRSQNGFSKLAILSLRGACRLSDSGLKKLVMSAPALRSINLGQCTLLTSNSINLTADYLGSNLRELYIDDCHKIDAMLILPAFKKFRYLEVLSVAGINTITDQFVSEIVTICGRSIKELDLANCPQLTDCSLKTIGSSCADLRSLNISNLHNLTDLGMEYIANGCKSIQKLKLCRNEFSDEAVAAFLESSGESLMELLLNNMTKVGPNTAFSLAKRSRKLLSLDISWCRKISNEALGLIVDSCSSLKLLKVFGCRQITKEFLNGHSNQLVRIIGLNLTPILDHVRVNLLEPEEVLLQYSPLPVCMED